MFGYSLLLRLRNHQPLPGLTSRVATLSHDAKPQPLSTTPSTTGSPLPLRLHLHSQLLFSSYGASQTSGSFCDPFNPATLTSTKPVTHARLLYITKFNCQLKRHSWSLRPHDFCVLTLRKYFLEGLFIPKYRYLDNHRWDFFNSSLPGLIFPVI